MRHEKLFYHHPISEEKILWRVLSSNWSIDITLLCRVNRRGTCVKLFMKGLKFFHLIPAGARRGHRCDQEDVEELQLEDVLSSWVEKGMFCWSWTITISGKNALGSPGSEVTMISCWSGLFRKELVAGIHWEEEWYMYWRREILPLQDIFTANPHISQQIMPFFGGVVQFYLKCNTLTGVLYIMLAETWIFYAQISFHWKQVCCLFFFHLLRLCSVSCVWGVTLIPRSNFSTPDSFARGFKLGRLLVLQERGDQWYLGGRYRERTQRWESAFFVSIVNIAVTVILRWIIRRLITTFGLQYL